MLNLPIINSRKIFTLLAIVILAIVFLSLKPFVFAATGIPRTINFQGKLVNNSSGINVTNSTYSVVFTLYDKDSGGTALWTETQSVTTVDGIFRVALGSVTPIPSNFNFNWDGLYLGMKVGADSEMTPRIQMASVPFAFNSQKVAGLTVQDTSGNASTSGTLQIANAKTINLGTQNLTLTTTGDTTITLPTTGTLLTNSATAVQTITSTQGTGTVLAVADSSALSGALTGFAVNLTSSTNSQNKTGLSFDLSGGTGATYYDILGTGSTWSITRAGVLTVSSCTGCGGGGASYWNLVSGNGVSNGGYITPINSTADFFLGGQATTSAKFGVLNLNSGIPIATIAGNFVIQPQLGGGGRLGIGTDPSVYNYLIDATKDINDISTVNVWNPNLGSAAWAGFRAGGSQSSGDNIQLLFTGSQQGGSALNRIASSALLESGSGASGGLILITDHSSAPIIFATGGNALTNERLRITSTGVLSLGSTSGESQLSVTRPLSWGATGKSLAILNQIENQDIFTASASGTPVITISRAGGLGIGGGPGSSPNYGTGSNCLLGGTTISWGSCAAGSGDGIDRWQVNNGVLSPGNQTLDFAVGGTASTSAKLLVSQLGTNAIASVAGSTSFSALVVDNSGTGSLFTASSSGLTRFVINKNGGVGINTASIGDGLELDVNGSARIGTTAVAAPDDIMKTDTTDFTVSGYSATTVTTSGDKITLPVNQIASAKVPAAGPNTTYAVATWSAALTRADGKVLVITGDSANTSGNVRKTTIYESRSNTFLAGPSLVNTPHASNAAVFQLANGTFLVALGNGSQIYNQAGVNGTGSFTQGAPLMANPASPNTNSVVGAGARFIRRFDGSLILILGGNSTMTNIYNPTNNQFIYGPSLTTGVASGSAVFQRPDGKWIVVVGGGTSTTNIYDPSLGNGGAFTAGPALAAGNANYGANVFQLSDGRFMLINGGGTNTTNIYNPISNTFTSGPTLTTNVGSGSQTIQRSDGKWLVVAGGGSKAVNLYDPTTNTFSQPANSDLTAPAGVGAVTFQREDGKYIVVHGGNYNVGVNVVSTTLYDAGWQTSGIWISEDINNTKISTYSAISWVSNPQIAATPSSNVTFQVKTSPTQGGLATATWNTIANTGDLIQAVAGAQWIKIQALFAAQIPQPYTVSIPNNIQSGVWPAEGGVSYFRYALEPTLFRIRIINPIAGYGGWVSTDLYNGRNEATQGAVLDNVVIDNTNRLTLATNRFNGSASASAGVIIASASANLGGAAGAGSVTITLPSGKLLVILGQAKNSTVIYDPITGQSTAGPILSSATTTTGTFAFQRPDGNFVVVIGGTAITNIYNVSSNTFSVGPSLSGNAGTGAHAIQRPDGKFVIFRGGTTVFTNIYDPISNSMVDGPQVTGGSVGAGAFSIRRSDGRYLTILGNNTAVVNLYDPYQNSFTLGAAVSGAVSTNGNGIMLPNGRVWATRTTTTSETINPLVTAEPVAASGYSVAGPAITSIGVGSHMIPMADGKVMLFTGNSVSYNVYNPAANTMVVSSTGTVAVGALPQTVGDGAQSIQLPNGKFLVISGNNTTNTMIVDTGFVMNGTYISEPIYAPTLSSATSLLWKNVGGGNVNAKYRTAASSTALTTTQWVDLEKDDGALAPNPGDQWVQIRLDLQAYLPKQPYEKVNVTSNTSAGGFRYWQAPSAPILQYWRLVNNTDPNLLVMTSGGQRQFRFQADGQAFTALNGAWNTGGADLAERYTSKEVLEAGEVVVGDKFNAQNVIRATTPYQSNIMGVVSTQPGFVAGAYTPDSYPIALVGRVPVKISNENGEVRSGDYLTSASIPGYAMKATVAGRVLGTALEDFDSTKETVECPTDGYGSIGTTRCGVITAFINLTSYTGADIETLMADRNFALGISQTGLQSDSFLNGVDEKDRKIVEFLKSLKEENGVESNSQMFTGRLSAVKILSSDIVADLITAKTIRADRIEGLEILTNQISSLNSRLNTLTSTGSGVLGDATESANLNTTFDLNNSATASADFNIRGNSVVEGMFMVLKTITTPNLLVSDFASFFGDVVFKKNVNFEGRPTFNNDTAGFAIVSKGDSSVEIEFDDEYREIPVITASIVLDKADNPQEQKQLEDEILSGNLSYIVTQRTTKGFVIRLNKLANANISFSWVAISVKNAKTVTKNSNRASINPQATQSAGFQSIVNQLNLSNSNQNGGEN